jgi:hypothetical protein
LIETRYKKVDWTLDGLINAIEMGDIGLPDIQRPFVWPKTKVRDLFDSMYRGYPVGYLLFWANSADAAARAIGEGGKQHLANRLIIDGQQRLTSLFAVMTRKEVLRHDFETERITIAFRPTDETFEVSNAAIKRDREWIADISQLWAPGVGFMKFVQSYLDGLREGRALTDEHEQLLADRIDRVKDLRNYPFTALELAENVDEEHVAEVFVRINSQGTPLNQTDFILTLMSVFWEKGRRQLEEFAKASKRPSKSGPSPYNHFIEPEPDQLLRVAVGLAFRRARMNYVYLILRGKDLDTKQFSEERRTDQFERLAEAQEYGLDLLHWHEFFKAVVKAGYRRGSEVTSKTGLLYSYVLYLIGKRDFGVDPDTLRDVIARWFFMTSLTARYSSSPESAMEVDLGRLDEAKDASGFVEVLDRVILSTLTSDYWSISLVNDFESAAARTPSLYGYLAALNLLDARALFSDLRIAELLDPATKGKKAPLERHHLFPKSYLEQIGIARRRETHQLANFAYIEWGKNASISSKPPFDYWAKVVGAYTPSELREAMYLHALPDGWQDMDYLDFLPARRKMMARVVRDAFEKLTGGLTATDAASEKAADHEARASRKTPSNELIEAGESQFVEFKESARWSYIQGHKDKVSSHEVLRTVTAFLNAHGGTLFIGISDRGEAIGLAADFKSFQDHKNEDGFMNWVVTLLRDKLGATPAQDVDIRFEMIDGHVVCRVDVEPHDAPVHLDGREFYVRLHNTTQQLSGDELLSYVKRHWH